MLHQLHTSSSSLSSHDVLLSLPQPSLTPSLFSNPSAEPVSNVQKLIVSQVRPEPAAETSQGTWDMPTIFHNLWRDCCVREINQPKVNNPLRCEVCKLDFNSRSVFEGHMSGKKHKKNMQLQKNKSNTILSGTSNVHFQLQNNSLQGQELALDAGHDLKSKKQRLLSRGEPEHNDRVDLTSNNGIDRKKVKASQPVRCDICMIDCNTKDIYMSHLSGKKHLRNLGKLSKSKGVVGAGAGASVAGTMAATVTANDKQLALNPAIESQERPVTDKHECVNSYRPENAVVLEAPEKLVTDKQECDNSNAVMLEAPENDTETKKPKHELEGGTSITSTESCTLSNFKNETVLNLPDCPARCEICMICCNSKLAYISHVSGKRHKRNLERVSKSKNDGAGASVAGAVTAGMTAINMQQAMNQTIEPQRKLETGPQEGMDTNKSGNVVMLEAPEMDIETKRRKIEPYVGASTTFLKVCKLCNIPCNGEAVFNSHMNGKKHAAMMKKLAKSKSSWGVFN